MSRLSCNNDQMRTAKTGVLHVHRDDSPKASRELDMSLPDGGQPESRVDGSAVGNSPGKLELHPSPVAVVVGTPNERGRPGPSRSSHAHSTAESQGCQLP